IKKGYLTKSLVSLEVTRSRQRNRSRIRRIPSVGAGGGVNMKRLTLSALFLSCLFAFPLIVHAQESAVASLQEVSAKSGTSMQTELTPLQKDELRADILMARKMYPEAARSYERLAKQEPHNAALLNKLGIAYEGGHNDGPAERSFKKAIKEDKTYASAYNNVGTVEYDRRKYSHAIDWYQKTLALRPDMAPVYYNLGCAYFDAKRYPEAMDAFQRAIQIDPQVMAEHGSGGSVIQPRGTTNMAFFYFLVARTYAQMGNAERAAHYLTMSRDDGYKQFAAAKTDPTFARVIKDPRVLAVFQPVPELAQKHH
ncbi:MAG: tetratricopeptide repeat protein, partial [Candidatus Acidiferrales bacterium]